MSPNSRLPAIAGVAARTQRAPDPREALGPLDLMEQVLRSAAEDAGAPKLLENLDAILVPQGLWKHGDPGRELAERVGASSVTTGVGEVSGHIVQTLLDWAFREIAAGRRDVVAVVGAESENSRRRLTRQGIPIPWKDGTPGEPDLRIGSDKWTLLEHERNAGVFLARNSFALCDTALRHARGESPLQHRVRISELYSRLSAVAARNPHAWIDRHVSAEEIRTPTPANRMVSYPYTKLMTSNIAVDQAGALILCSVDAARRFGIADDRLVYLRAATEMHHVRSLSEREHLYHHPGMQMAGQRVLELVDTPASKIAHVDLYSCFPFAVQAGAAALGLDEQRPLTVTGGLTFGGGPFANYVIQATARTISLLREQPGSLGLVGSIGGTFAKFAFGIYSTDPGDKPGLQIEDVSAGFAAIPGVPYASESHGDVSVESYVVDVEASGPVKAIFSGKNAAGERVWAKSEDPELMAALIADEDACGREAQVRDGVLALR